MIIRKYSYPRAALVGNPSDGYYGKTIAFVFNNFQAEVVLYETPELEIMPQERDRSVFKSLKGLYEDVNMYGYYGGIRLLKAAIKQFCGYCIEHGHQIHNRNFTIRYGTNIPNRLGLAGSSAIISACMKALMTFYEVEIPRPLLANLVLSVEKDELRIGAGLQDRVAQAFETPVYMDFDKAVMDRQGYGAYQAFGAQLLPPLYIAYRTDLSEGSEVVHNDLKGRYKAGDPTVLDAVKRWATITEEVMQELESGNPDKIGALLNENFDLRRSIMNLSSENVQMVELARSVGASAKFTGSGGAIIGTYSGEKMFNELINVTQKAHIEVIKPIIISY